jgi:hypothetical protein
VAEVTAAYRDALRAVAAGDRVSADALRRVTNGAFTRGHFARAV